MTFALLLLLLEKKFKLKEAVLELVVLLLQVVEVGLGLDDLLCQVTSVFLCLFCLEGADH